MRRSRLRLAIATSSSAFWLVLGTLCVMSFGLLIPWLGFYWDDWHFIWLSHVVPPLDLRYLEIHRPLTGWLFMLLRPVLGETPLPWQFFNLVSRWLAGVALWWAVQQFWPERRVEAAWVALAFTTYPGFGHQYVSVNTSRHILPLALLIVSFGLSALASRRRQRFWPLTLSSILLSVVSMLTTDYYFGLEPMRAVFIWLATLEPRSWVQRVIGAMKDWVPSLTAWIIVASWRFLLIPQVYYHASPSKLVLTTDGLARYAGDLVEAGVIAWTAAYNIPRPLHLSLTRVLVYFALVGCAAALVGAYLWMLRGAGRSGNSAASPMNDKWSLTCVAVGIAAMVGGALPSWATGLPIDLTFTFSRLTLPMMMGAAFLLVGALRAIRPQPLGLALFAITIGLGVGKNFATALSFREDWERQKAFFWQLLWRVPGLEPGTMILTQPLPFDYETDNSISAVVNWIYGSANRTDDMWYMVFDLKLRDWLRVSGAEREGEITWVYRTFARNQSFRFAGSMGHALVVYYPYPACLRVVEPLYDQYTTGYSPYLTNAIDVSRTDLIIPIPSQQPELPPALVGTEPQPNWCYYYQKADLARQMGDWDRVGEMALAAMALNVRPRHASEYVLFIEGLGRMGRLDEAHELTRLAIARDVALDRMLCAVWERLETTVALTPDQAGLVRETMSSLSCSPQ